MVRYSAYYEKPYSLLAIRLEEVGHRREYSHSDPIPGLIQKIYSENQNR